MQKHACSSCTANAHAPRPNSAADLTGALTLPPAHCPQTAPRLSVVRTYCGHGIGDLFHCAPNVPHYAKNKAKGTMKVGEVFTIGGRAGAVGQWAATWHYGGVLLQPAHAGSSGVLIPGRLHALTHQSPRTHPHPPTARPQSP